MMKVHDLTQLGSSEVQVRFSGQGNGVNVGVVSWAFKKQKTIWGPIWSCNALPLARRKLGLTQYV